MDHDRSAAVRVSSPGGPEAAVAWPDHVPAHLAFDFDALQAPGAAEDVHAA